MTDPFYAAACQTDFPCPTHRAEIAERTRGMCQMAEPAISGYEEICREDGCYIQTGSFLEADPDYPEDVFNTTVRVGPSGVLSKYRKVNTWLPWEIHTSPHDVDAYPECVPTYAAASTAITPTRDLIRPGSGP